MQLSILSKKGKHYLLGNSFTCITDQRSVSFMFDQQNHGKIKNDKIARSKQKNQHIPLSKFV